MTNKLTSNLTSYDLLKAAAVIIMIIDHVGYYFYPEEMWWRAVGRIGFPIWFFLVGYARGRDFSPKLWIGAVLLIGANVVAGLSIFPLNALFTIILIRLVLDPLMLGARKNAEIFMVVSVILLFLVLPSYAVTEYGTQGIITAMFGYILRNRLTIPGFKSHAALSSAFCLFTILNFIGIQQLIFGFDTPQMLFLFTGTFAVGTILYFFQPIEFPKLTRLTPGLVRAGIQFMGRRTLEIYVAHLILFKFLGVLTQPERFKLFQWTWLWTGG
ncbi:MAG: TraX family protein [Micavibrio sp.]